MVVFNVCFQYTTLISIIFYMVFKKVQSLGCFKCVSYNGSDEHCSDPYHPMFSTYVTDCFAGRPNRRGSFPARFCYKIRGVHVHQSQTDELYVRDCSAEDLGNMCGQFEFQGKRMNGCILTCIADGCNKGNLKIINNIVLYIIILLLCYANLLLPLLMNKS